MAKLILSMEGQVLKEIPLSKERITIGRKPHNDIQIDNLAVSGEHAVIVSVMEDAFLEDLGSTNGTVVNGKTVKKHFLQDNDVVELGKYKLKYMQEKGKPAVAAAAPSAKDFEKTMVLRPSAMKAAVEQAKAMAGAEGQPAAAQAMRAAAVQQAAASAAASGLADKEAKTPPATEKTAPAHDRTITEKAAVAEAPAPAPAPAGSKQQIGAIQLLSGANAGREMELSKPLTRLGKVGVQVAVLTRRPQGYFITHLEGEKLPQVNGQAIGNAPHPLRDHDVIELAGVKMEFFLKG